MYQSTTAFGEMIQQDSRTFKACITIGNNSITEGIMSIKISGGSNSEDDFSIGSAVSQYVEMILENTGLQFEGHEFLLEVGMLVDDQVKEYVPMGYFTAEKPETDDEWISFTARDRMIKMEQACFLELPEDTDTVEVLQAMEMLTGVKIITNGLTPISMKKPVNHTCREVLSLIAQMYGGFAICNRQGQIEVHTYEDIDYTVGPERYWGSFTHNDFPFTVDQLTCYTGKDDAGNNIAITVGNGARGTSFSNAYMTQSILNNIWSKIGGFSYMPGNIRFLGDPRIDPWDILTVKDCEGNSYKVPVMKLNHEFDGGFTTEVEAVGKSEAEQENGFQGPMSQQMERLSTQLLLVDKALINKLDAEEAKITYASIQNLNAVNAQVQDLYADHASFKEMITVNLEAAVADINVLNADMANLKTFLAGNGAAGDFQVIHLTTENAVLDSALVRVAVMESVSINDLLAGTISTNKFRIASDDGAISIEGATQQWRDENGVVRMQAGLDANGEFTFSLFDEKGTGILIDSTGIKEAAIADGLIVNSMVADNAAIDAKKLDIVSLYREMNASKEILYSSRIWLDEYNQTLNQAYSQMLIDINNTDTRVTNLQTGIDGLQLNISQITEEVNVLTDNTLLQNVDYVDNGDETVTLTQVVYRNGKDVTAEFPAGWFDWCLKTEDGDAFLGYGYSMKVKKDIVGFGGTVTAGFTTYKKDYLMSHTGSQIITSDGSPLIVWAQE